MSWRENKDDAEEEVNEQKNQFERALEGRIEEYGEARENEGRLDESRRNFWKNLLVGISAISITGTGLSALYLASDEQERRVRGPVEGYQVDEVDAARALSDAKSGFEGIGRYLESEENAQRFADALERDASATNEKIYGSARKIKELIPAADQDGDSSASSFELYLAPGDQSISLQKISDRNGFSELWRQNAGNIDNTEREVYEQLDNNDWGSTEAIVWLEDEGAEEDAVYEETVVGLNSQEYREIQEEFGTAGPYEFDF